MSRPLDTLRPVYVVGIGWHRYQNPSEIPYVTLGLKAIRDALGDAGIDWEAVDSSYIGHCLLGMAPGRPILRHLGALGKPLVHIENASASGSTAFRHACIEVGAGMSDVALVLGIDKRPEKIPVSDTGIPSLAGDAIAPFTHFALLMNRYQAEFGVSDEDFARVAVKNHRNGSLNPNAQRQQARTLEEVLGGRPIAGTLTALQCTPIGEGAAATIVASEDAIKRLGIDASRAIRVASSAAGSEQPSDPAVADAALSVPIIKRALAEAGHSAREVDILELHDAFTIEEFQYAEASGICPPGHYAPMLKEGAFDIGGQCAVSPSGGLIAMGHPVGPTGVGQVAEIVLQLRGEAGARQHKDARIGLAHMVGVGAVCYAHVLAR